MSIESRLFSALALSLTVTAAACDDDAVGSPDPMEEEPGARSFRVRIENIAPWTVLKSGLHNTKTTGAAGALSSGEAYELSFTAGAKQSVSFATMLGESNDWFFAP